MLPEKNVTVGLPGKQYVSPCSPWYRLLLRMAEG